MILLNEQEPLSYDLLLTEMAKAGLHANKIVARWKQAVDEEDPAHHVWHDLAVQHGLMYMVLKALLDARKIEVRKIGEESDF